MQRLTLRDSITQARVAERRLAVHDSSPAWLDSRVWEWRTELRLTVTSESSRASSAVGSADFGSQTADLAHTGPRHEGTLTWLASQQLFGAAKLLASDRSAAIRPSGIVFYRSVESRRLALPARGAEPVLPGNWPARAQGTTATCSSTATAHQRGTAQQAVRLGPLAWSSSNTRTSRCQGDYHHTRLSLLSARQ